MEIFSDAAAGGGMDDPAGPWEEFGTRDGRRKENTMEAKPWAGETMPQKKTMPRTPKMEVFRDAVSFGRKIWADA
jgi:checkpoint serine/threonine-protein kinase